MSDSKRKRRESRSPKRDSKSPPKRESSPMSRRDSSRSPPRGIHLTDEHQPDSRDKRREYENYPPTNPANDRNLDDGRKLYIANLSERTTEEDLQHAFRKFGPVKNVKLILYHQTGRSKGYGFVTMENIDDAEAAQREAHNKLEMDGKEIIVEIARGIPKEESQRRYENPRGNEPRRDYDPRLQRRDPIDARIPRGYPEDNSRSRYPEYPPFALFRPDFPLMLPSYREDPYNAMRAPYRAAPPFRGRDERDYGRTSFPPNPYMADYYRGGPSERRPKEVNRDMERERYDERDRMMENSRDHQAWGGDRKRERGREYPRENVVKRPRDSRERK